MLPDLLGKLAGDAIRNLARNLFAGFYERGISGNQALRELQDLGLGYRRGDFLADYREGLTNYDHATSIRHVGLENTPSERALEPLYHGVPDKYSLVFKVEGTDLSTGESGERYFFYHRNSLDTRDNMEQEALDWFGEQASRYGFEASGIKVVEGYINPVWQ